MKVAVYPGSFDPITNGHLDVLERALKVFDKVVVLIGVNPEKKSRFSPVERKEMIVEAVSHLKNVEVDIWDGLTIEYLRQHNIFYLIRGLRAVTDFDYEFQMASANEYIDSRVDTVFLMSKVEKSFINSSVIMELNENGVDISSLVPPSVIKRLKK